MSRRDWFIELIAYWEGRLTTRHLCEQFGISRQQASKDLGTYNQASATPLVYTASVKGFVPPDNFSPLLLTTQADEYLTWLASYSPYRRMTETAKHTFQLSPPQRQVSPNVMRGLVAAMRQQRRLEVDYVSLSHPDREGRIIVPHTFVDTGARWHLRAWCEKHAEYRDFVLSRFRGKPELAERSSQGVSHDVAWNTQIEMIFKPDLRLSPAQQAVIAEDYQMQQGQLHMTTRAALVSYLLKQMQVNTKMIDANPQAQQLMLDNLDDIKPWLIG
ncbi:helix-turn-helix transcriptional regulator [Agarivorans sp. QJM3NY_33]|uniref:helix-turn-helix transcriptional regulator n=1 Tax=Agarivorans sp. QJM3NY_33 TaxID=3421432 RepID=UPI003D7E1688